MRALVVRALCALALLFVTTQMAGAWNKPGHMATGSVAYRILKKDSPGTVTKAVTLLKKHVYYKEKWKKQLDNLADDEDRDEYLFMLAARWADDARVDDRFYPENGHLDMIHYINQPFKPAGQAESVKTEKEADINLLRGYSDMLEQFKTGATDADKATGLCWVLHLIGDAHQPLHTVSLYTSDFQLKEHGRLVGDRGGTWFYVKHGPGGSGVSLHTIWDGFITAKDKYRDNHNAVTVLMAMPEHAADKLAADLMDKKFENWVGESFTLAKESAYFHGGELLKGGTKASMAQELPTNYTKACQPVAQRRGVLAGYRIAAVLKDVLGE